MYQKYNFQEERYRLRTFQEPGIIMPSATLKACLKKNKGVKSTKLEGEMISSL